MGHDRRGDLPAIAAASGGTAAQERLDLPQQRLDRAPVGRAEGGAQTDILARASRRAGGGMEGVESDEINPQSRKAGMASKPFQQNAARQAGSSCRVGTGIADARFAEKAAVEADGHFERIGPNPAAGVG